MGCVGNKDKKAQQQQKPNNTNNKTGTAAPPNINTQGSGVAGANGAGPNPKLSTKLSEEQYVYGYVE